MAHAVARSVVCAGAFGRALGFLCALAACTSVGEVEGFKGVSARPCPEAVRISAAGNVVGVESGHIRYCFPGEANCYCDRDDDCYAQSGYVACVPPGVDAGSAEDADAGASNVCPEAVRISASGNVVGVVSGHIRYCFPGEARCFCDSDNDCYAQSGYVPCTPPSQADAAPDASASVDVTVDAPEDVALDVSVDASVDVTVDVTVDASVDVTVDASVATPEGVCPEEVRISAAGNRVGVVSGHIRYCFPGEARCYCDSDNDCYAESGYVPCTPPSLYDAARDVAADEAAVDAAPDATVDAVFDRPASDASLAPDPVSYTGSFAAVTGLSRARLVVAGVARTVWVYAPASRTARPPLMIALHDTDATGDAMLDASGARRVADAQGVVVVSPDARYTDAAGADYDNPLGRATYWNTRDTSPTSNPDLVLVRAAIVEAQRTFNSDPDRVYALGHGNGGFMALLTATALSDRIAGFAENAAGMVSCASRAACAFRGSALTCGALAAEPGWCACAGPGLPVAPAAETAVPGYLSHGVDDAVVSVRYTCALAQRLQSMGVPTQTALFDGPHYLPAHFATGAWSFLAPLRRR